MLHWMHRTRRENSSSQTPVESPVRREQQYRCAHVRPKPQVPTPHSNRRARAGLGRHLGIDDEPEACIGQPGIQHGTQQMRTITRGPATAVVRRFVDDHWMRPV